MNKTMTLPKIALGAWSWGTGAAGGAPFDVERWTPDLIPLAKVIDKGTLPIIGETKVKQVEEAVAAAQIALDAEEVIRLEKLGDKTGVHTLREWEKEMA